MRTSCCFFVLLAGCGGDMARVDADADSDTDTDSDTDADTDADTDSDTESDSDSDSGTGTGTGTGTESDTDTGSDTDTAADCGALCDHALECDEATDVPECNMLCDCLAVVWRPDFATPWIECMADIPCDDPDMEETCAARAAGDAFEVTAAAEAFIADCQAALCDPAEVDCDSFAVVLDEVIADSEPCLEEPGCPQVQACLEDVVLGFCFGG